MKIAVDLDSDQITEVVRQDLQFQYNSLRKSVGDIDGIRVYHTDYDEDQREIKKMLKAFKRVYSWYTTTGKDIDDDY